MKVQSISLYCLLSMSAVFAADPAPAAAAPAAEVKPEPPTAAAPAAEAKPDPAPAVPQAPLDAAAMENFINVIREGSSAAVIDRLNADARLANAEIVDPEEGVVTALSAALMLEKSTRMAILEQLIEHGADVNQRFGLQNDTPLIYVVRKEEVPALELFLTVKYPAIQIRNSKGESAANLALQISKRHKNKNTALFQMLKKKALSPEFKKLESLKKHAFTAAQNNKKDDLIKLLEQGVELNIQRDDGETLLSLAAASGAKDVVTYLIEKKVPLNSRNMTGATPLIAAAKNKQAEIMSLLLAAGASPDSADILGTTALMTLATLSPDAAPEKLAMILIKANADLEIQDRDGATVLMYAVLRGNKDFIKVLLEAGADAEATNHRDRSAFDLTADPEIKKMLTEIKKAEARPAEEKSAETKPGA